MLFMIFLQVFCFKKQIKRFLFKKVCLHKHKNGQKYYFGALVLTFIIECDKIFKASKRRMSDLNNKKGYLGGSLMLVAAAFFWGTTFIAQSNAMNSIGPFTFSAIRSAIAVPLLLIIYLIINRKDPLAPFKKDSIALTLKGGITCGLILFIATNLQNTGLIETSPGEGGFITAL